MDSDAPPFQRQLIEDGSKLQTFPAELSLFQAPALSAAYTSLECVDYSPLSPHLNNEASIDFCIPGTVSSFVSLKDLRLHMKIRLVKGDGTIFDVDAQKLVGVINFLPATMFETVHVYLNQVNK